MNWQECFHHAGRCMEVQQFAEAFEFYERAARAQPNVGALYTGLGNSLKALGHLDEAITVYQHAVTLEAQPGAYNNMGVILADRRQWREAIACYQEGLQHFPGTRELWENCGIALTATEEFNPALEAFQRALALDPAATTWHALGRLFMGCGRTSEACDCFRTACALDPNFHDAAQNLAGALWESGDAAAAETHFRTLLARAPHLAGAHSNLLLVLHYLPDITPAQLLAEHRAWATQHTAAIAPRQLHSNRRDPERVLRIGYVSPDFREHSVAFFIAPILATHDATHFQTFCYAHVAAPDAMTHRLRQHAHCWHNIVDWSDDTVAARIVEDEIDILVDLTGHTAWHRLRVFARKPAPIQVTYLGYFDTTGVPTIDYRITDRWSDPADYDQWYTERLVRLPSGFSCYEPPPTAPAVALPPALARGSITFGSFNQLAKVTPSVIALWAELLQRVPRSRLFMKSKSLSDEGTKARVRELFAAQDIGKDRLLFGQPLRDVREHLSVYSEVDIALDPFPMNGATTTCETLWMGVPVITLAGQTHAGRVGASILTRVGLPECVATTPQEYLAVAQQLAADIPRLANTRKNLREQMAQSAVCNAAQCTHELEAAYRKMWYEFVGDK